MQVEQARARLHPARLLRERPAAAAAAQLDRHVLAHVAHGEPQVARHRSPASLHAFGTPLVTSANGSARPLQFSSTAFPRRSRAPGRRAGIAVIAVDRAREPVAVAVKVGRVGSVAVLVDPVVEHIDRAGPDPRLGVVAVGGAGGAVAVDVGLEQMLRCSCSHPSVTSMSSATSESTPPPQSTELGEPVEAGDRRPPPSPASMVSVPAPPSIVSLPPRPRSRLPSTLPVMTSLPARPLHVLDVRVDVVVVARRARPRADRRATHSTVVGAPVKSTRSKPGPPEKSSVSAFPRSSSSPSRPRGCCRRRGRGSRHLPSRRRSDRRALSRANRDRRPPVRNLHARRPRRRSGTR